MRLWFMCAAGMAGLMLILGCEPLQDIVDTNRVRVRLVNNARSPVAVTIYISGNQNIVEDLLTSVGTKIEYTIAPESTETFTRSCDDLQAIIIDRADLQIIGGIGPSTGSRVYRDGADFGCGDTITFTFSATLLPPTFNIDFSKSSSWFDGLLDQ